MQHRYFGRRESSWELRTATAKRTALRPAATSCAALPRPRPCVVLANFSPAFLASRSECERRTFSVSRWLMKRLHSSFVVRGDALSAPKHGLQR